MIDFRNTERLATSLSLTCKEVRLICSEGPDGVLRAFFDPKLPLNQIFPRVSLGAHFATASVANKSHLVHAQSVCTPPDCLQTVLPVFSLGTYLFIHRTLEQYHIQSWPSVKKEATDLQIHHYPGLEDCLTV